MKKLQMKVEVNESFLPGGKFSPLLHRQIRVTSSVSFVNQDQKSLSKIHSAILDTGAPISVIPQYIWENLYVKKFGQVNLGGIHQGKNCQIPCHVGMVLMRIYDSKRKQFYNLNPIAYLVSEEFDKIPLVLGYDRCLEYFTLEANIPHKMAYLIQE